MSDSDSISLVAAYRTKAAWPLHVNKDGLPALGYQHDYYLKQRISDGTYKQLPQNTNVLLCGTLMLTSVSRGRSAASFMLTSRLGWRAHTTLSGAFDMFTCLSEVDCSIGRATFVERRYAPYMLDDSTVPVQGAAICGYWTVTKQGTEISLIPVSLATKDDLMKRIVDISEYVR